MTLHCSCYPVEKDGYEFVHWIALVFKQCMWTPRDQVSFFLGLANIGCWMVAQLPQVWQNYRRRDAGALSFGFIFTWLLGDITNLIGCVLTRQLAVQLYTAIYYVSIDAVLCSQYAYYGFVRRRGLFGYKPLPSSPEPRRPSINADSHSDTQPLIDGSLSQLPPQSQQPQRLSAVIFGSLALLFTLGAATFASSDIGEITTMRAGGRMLLSTDPSMSSSSTSLLPNCSPVPNLATWERIIGDICAWVCFVLYFFGRVPQIFHNYKRKSVEGLSYFMFICAILGNLCYGTSIVLAGVDVHATSFWESVLPYMLGSYLCIIWPCVVLGQFFYYTKVYNKRRISTKYKAIPSA